MNSAHFIYIPVCILIGVVFGWILGGRAAMDAYSGGTAQREDENKNGRKENGRS